MKIRSCTKIEYLRTHTAIHVVQCGVQLYTVRVQLYTYTYTYSTKVHMRSLFDDAVNESHVLNIFREELGVCSAAARSRFLLLLSSGITKAGSKNVPGYANVLALCLRLFS
eukprot:15064-Pelagococcus_subviridis.AAC.5